MKIKEEINAKSNFRCKMKNFIALINCQLDQVRMTKCGYNQTWFKIHEKLGKVRGNRKGDKQK